MVAIFFKAKKKGTLKEASIRKVLRAEAFSIAADMMLDLAVATAYWKRDVKFKRVVEVRQDTITIMVGSDDEIYGYVNEGTEAHIILPVNYPMLHFKGTFQAKSIPGVLTSRPGSYGGKDIWSKGVIHPGIEPRNFDQALVDKWQSKFNKRIENALQEALAEAWVAEIGR